ncbi:MAG TPA: hypothetical protein VHP30_09065, partial [Ignavibacteriales bacterium]|nr:hypothetical protein [Ignavibacteriales bacterium]
MKNFLLTILMACTFASLCFPQGMTDKGSMSLSGAAFFSYTKYSDDAIDRKISIQPGISYFFFNNLELGINAKFSYSHHTETIYYINDPYGYYEVKTANFVDSRDYGIGAFISGYLGKGKAKPFLRASIFYDYISFSPGDIYYTNNPVSATSYSIGLGYLIPLNKNIAITPLLQYEFMEYHGMQK